MRFLRRLSRGLCSETYGLTGIYEGEAQGLIAVTVEQFPTHPNRTPYLGHHRVLVYAREDFSLVGHYDARLEINHIAFDPDISQLAIAYGSYDGGTFYEGGLALWNYENGAVRELISDDRQIIHCAFSNSNIEFTVLPHRDIYPYQESAQTLTTYSLVTGVSESASLSKLTPIRVQKDLPPGHREAEDQASQYAIARERLKELIDDARGAYEPAGAVWDMLIEGSRLYSAHGNGELKIWDLRAGSCRTISLTEETNPVTRVFYRDETYFARVEADIDGRIFSLLYNIDPQTLSSQLVSQEECDRYSSFAYDKDSLEADLIFSHYATAALAFGDNQAIATLRDGTRALVSRNNDATISTQWEMETPCDILSLAFHNGILAAGGIDGNIYLFDIEQTEEVSDK